MPDTILAVAEAERHRAEIALDAHYDTCDIWGPENCPKCRELAALAGAAASRFWRLEAQENRAEDERAARWRRGRVSPGRKP